MLEDVEEGACRYERVEVATVYLYLSDDWNSHGTAKFE